MFKAGNLLRAEVQQELLRAFDCRYTGQHKPAWAIEPMPNGKPYPVQFLDDADWLRNTLFHVTKKGELHRCFSWRQSNPTWPFNPELR